MATKNRNKYTAITCKNCHQRFYGNYCNNCGQTAATHALGLHYVWHDLQHALFHFDKGIFFSARQLFTRPGHSVREFIEGKRVRHFKPGALVVLLASVYGVLFHFLHIDLTHAFDPGGQQTVGFDTRKFNDWTAGHYALVTLATIPLYTVGTFLCFRSQGYNFIEFLVLNAFKASQRLFVHIPALLLQHWFAGTAWLGILTAGLYVLDVTLGFWTNIQFFHKLTKTRTILLSMASHAIFLVIFLSILELVVLILEAV